MARKSISCKYRSARITGFIDQLLDLYISLVVQTGHLSNEERGMCNRIGERIERLERMKADLEALIDDVYYRYQRNGQSDKSAVKRIERMICRLEWIEFEISILSGKVQSI